MQEILKVKVVSVASFVHVIDLENGFTLYLWYMGNAHKCDFCSLYNGSIDHLLLDHFEVKILQK